MIPWMIRSCTFPLLLLLTCAVPVLARPAQTVDAAPAAPSSSDVADWLDRTERFYVENPHLQLPTGSHWKHFVKMKHFLDLRIVDGRVPTAADRVRAWEIHRERSAATPRVGGWFNLGPLNLSGRIVEIEFHPTDAQKISSASASGGLWLSSDGGTSWRTTTDELGSLAIGAVEVLDTNPDVVLIATGEGIFWSYVVFGVGIFKSTDAGETWGPTSLSHAITANHGFHVMESNPATGTILAGANDGLWRSTDEGDTWTLIKVGGDYYDVKWKIGDPSRVYTTKGSSDGGNNIKVSTDDGITWTKAGTGQPPSSNVSKTKLALTPADPTLIYAHYGSSVTYGTLGIYRSTDDGTTWSPRNTTLNISGGQGGYANTIAVDPLDVDRVIAGGIRVYVSTDGGTTFTETGAGLPLGTETAIHSDHHAATWEPGSTSNLWLGTDGGNWRSTDSGSTWASRRAGLVTFQFYDVCASQSDPAFVLGGSQDNGYPLPEGGGQWSLSTLTADGMACHIVPNTSTVYSEWQFGGHIKSTDAGLSWNPVMNGITGNGAGFTPQDLDVQDGDHLYTSTSDGIFRTRNGAATWVRMATHRATWISMSPVDGNVVWTTDYAASTFPVRVSTNDGNSWIAAAPYGFAVGNETKILAHPTDINTAFVTFAGYGGVAHVARTTDLGSTWTDVSGNFPPDPANTMAVDPDAPDHWYVGTDTGVWSSTDDGVTWTPLGTGLPNVVVYDLEIQRAARKLIAGTYGRGMLEIDIPVATGIAPPLALRADLLLDPPFPNPAADRVAIRFASRRAEAVSLDLHDVRGRRVANIARLPAGDGIVRRIEWIPDDLPSGVYFVVLRSGGERLSRKLVLTR